MLAINMSVTTSHAHSRTETATGTSLHVTRVTPQVIEEVRRRIIEAVQPQQIVLFGSQARGQAATDSDIDLLVVHNLPCTNREVRLRIERALLDRRFGLDLIVRTPGQVAVNVADGNPFYSEQIYGEGIILYDRSGEAAS
jgi:predicted nucleotidyltransferase